MVFSRGVFVMFGLHFPTFYLQLYATTHGIESQFAFYCVRIKFMSLVKQD